MQSSQRSPEATTGDKIFAAIQMLLPTHLLSRGMHRLTRIRVRWFKNLFIKLFLRLYPVDLSEAQTQDINSFDCFNEFFTRALHAQARPMAQDPAALLSPVDGTLGQFGTITQGRIVQAKGSLYSVADLLGEREDMADAFLGGQFATLYLAPYNYHRIHMPLAGVLRETHYVPGRLFGVNPMSVRAIPRLFTRNERLCTLFQTPAGPMAMVLVGAFFVGSIATTWAGEVTPPHRRRSEHESFPSGGDTLLSFRRGDEMGRFNMGSTVILLMGAGAVAWAENMQVGSTLRLGQSLGQVKRGS